MQVSHLELRECTHSVVKGLDSLEFDALQFCGMIYFSAVVDHRWSLMDCIDARVHKMCVFAIYLYKWDVCWWCCCGSISGWAPNVVQIRKSYIHTYIHIYILWMCIRVYQTTNERAIAIIIGFIEFFAHAFIYTYVFVSMWMYIYLIKSWHYNSVSFMWL